MSPGAAGKGPQFRIGRLLGETARVFARHAHRFLLLGVFPILPLAWSNLPSAADTRAAYLAANWLYPFLDCAAEAAAAGAVLQALRGEPVSLGGSLRALSGHLRPLLGTSVALTALYAAAAQLYDLPLLIVAMFLGVAIQACVVERLLVVDAFRRSIRLSAGARGRLLAVYAAVMAVTAALDAALGWLAPAIGNAAAVQAAWVAAMLTLESFTLVLTTVAYRDLRAVQDGPQHADIAAVFD